MVTKTVQFWHKADTCINGIEDSELNSHNSSTQVFVKMPKTYYIIDSLGVSK